jgi:4-hydroxybenzoate polyprenyltransferase/phosphoserine phosphatase
MLNEDAKLENRMSSSELISVAHEPPLCVDLDGTLLRTDTLHESLLVLLKESPWSVPAMALRLFHGRAGFKAALTRAVTLDPKLLPYNLEVLAFLREEKARGRRLVLATGANHGIADSIAQHLGLFNEVIASDDSRNLSGAHKGDALSQKYGKGNFDYIGNNRADISVWACARKAIVVTSDARLLKRAEVHAEVERVFTTEPAGIRVWLRALRFHQWAKNLLLFIPLFCSHRWDDGLKIERSILAFVSFSLCASGVYLLNDLLDMDSDRRHPTKRRRPFASGALQVIAGIIGIPVLLACSFLLILFLPVKFAAALAGYCMVTTLYTFHLKRIELIDVFTLACLYGLRVLAGAFATSVPISDWLLVFCIFLFLSLAFVKRFAELHKLQDVPKGRGYRMGDLELISTMGVASGYVATLVFALYVSNPAVTELYAHPHVLWLSCPIILCWISRVWLLAHRGSIHEDPIIFALKDKQSYLMAVALVLTILGARPR